ncbi:hypothetical protein [Porphyromonas pogonae]|uniref:hypothetical protein n=1 Tax=Porphyromonas pogonae TaxID=867595 RepID=UPI002E79ED9F|nr:hypothetical protein [Porphyromonas pogonae]
MAIARNDDFNTIKVIIYYDIQIKVVYNRFFMTYPLHILIKKIENIAKSRL